MDALLSEERAQGYDMAAGPLTRLRVVRVAVAMAIVRAEA